MTRDAMESEVAQLLLEQRRLARLGLKLGPKAFQRLKSLLLRLGYTKGVPMSRRGSVRRYAKVEPNLPSWLNDHQRTQYQEAVSILGTPPSFSGKFTTGGSDQVFGPHWREIPTVKLKALRKWAKTQGHELNTIPERARGQYQIGVFLHPKTVDERFQDAAGGDQDYRPDEMIPEDHYGMSRSPHVTRRLRYKAPLVVSYAKPPARPPHPDMPPQRTPTDLITHAAHALNNPTDSTAIRAFADHLMETPPDDPHAQAFIEWVNGGEWSGQRWKGAMYHPRGENLGSEGIATEPYFTLNPRRVITPGYAYKGDDSTQPLGLLAKRLNSPLWEFRSRMPRKMIASPLDGITHSATAPARRIPKLTSTEVAQHLYDVDGVRGLAIAVIGARHFHPDVTPPTPNTYTPSRPKFTRRRVSVKFAKAETTRHPAHPLIAVGYCRPRGITEDAWEVIKTL